MGEFYLVALPAKLLLDVCISEPAKLTADGRYKGGQRRLDPRRVKSISRYLQSEDAILPGTIIIAANCTKDSDDVIDVEGPDADKRWGIEVTNDISFLKIPSLARVAKIVDGQHRLAGFETLGEELKDIFLPCAVFLDLPMPHQAFIFATINFNQKPVNKSLTYELFGYNLDEESESEWAPDKLAVSFARQLNIDEKSPFKDHIKVAVQDDRVLDALVLARKKEWAISTATIVEGIISLMSNNSQEDRDKLKSSFKLFRSRSNLEQGKNPPPLRNWFIKGDRDIVIYKTVRNYFNAVVAVFWSKISPNSRNAIRKTAGIQALFRVLKILLPPQVKAEDVRQEIWEKLLLPAQKIDFSVSPFTESSGKGRAYIQDAILVAIGKKDIEDVRDEVLKAHLKEKLGRGDNAQRS